MLIRAVASLTVPGGQDFHFPHSFLKFRSIFLIFPQTFLIFFLILAFRVGDSPTRKGPGYVTDAYIIEKVLIVWTVRCPGCNVLEAQLMLCGFRWSETCGTEENGHQRKFAVRGLLVMRGLFAHLLVFLFRSLQNEGWNRYVHGMFSEARHGEIKLAAKSKKQKQDTHLPIKIH